MQLTRALYRHSVAFFLTFCAIVVWGFWRTYYSNPLQLSLAVLHVHGFMMTLWCVMVASQAYLIRSTRRLLHRWVGVTSYVIAPINVVLIIAALWIRVPLRADFIEQGTLLPRGANFIALSLFGALVFGLFYALAMLNRRAPAVHGRYMICTVFPIIGAAIDRIVGQNFMPAIASWLPQVAGRAYAPSVGFATTDVTLAALSAWDWKSHRRLDVFPVALAIMLAYQVFSMNAYRFPVWQRFAVWFAGAG